LEIFFCWWLIFVQNFPEFSFSWMILHLSSYVDHSLLFYCFSGTLEWAEKQKPNDTGPRVNRSLPCQICVGPEDVDMYVLYISCYQPSNSHNYHYLLYGYEHGSYILYGYGQAVTFSTGTGMATTF